MTNLIDIATWNVNSLKVRLPHLLQWLQNNPVDLIGLQELKMTDNVFPVDALEEAGYGAVFAGQKTYNGVAILYKKATMPTPSDVTVNLPSFPDEQKRVIGASFGDFRFVSAYVVNGSEVGSDKFEYKKAWLDALIADCAQWLSSNPKLALVGDFNIAPDDRDVHDPAAWKDQVLCSEDERSRFEKLLSLGLHDSFRLFEQADKTFSWWDYRQRGFQKNRGLRIDHVLISDALKSNCTASKIDRTPRKWEKPSDHAPAVATLSI
ncbi:exodeoxyribonuclease III [Limnobacter litoralis]|uniref:Exodeoxyribonuclease III n=1 Tax=Limnobacter litoralis TaxID=481366 RepID=A0ABQ5YQN9_9BURK|nr:exodeoxyribonuclease III [Limnobacter litoralis]GLR25761.1 exodeoxyribonuclease III [Limnobacter litoralis]